MTVIENEYVLTAVIFFPFFSPAVRCITGKQC